MEKYFLAVDIGASSGRHILAHLDGGKIRLEEIYRFPNGMIERDAQLVWDIERLFEEIKAGMKKCAEAGKIPVSMGIDTWGVDFVLLDAQGNIIGNAVAYRDNRTAGMDRVVYEFVDETKLYEITGIQKQIFNSIYQLMAIRVKNPEHLQKADKMLMIPDYLHYRLTGVTSSEYTNATTTQLVHPGTKDWNWDLIELLGYPKHIFQPLRQPGSELGELSEEVRAEVGFNCKVVLPATHDTASAVIAVPSADENLLYISSGTWSLMGTELAEANCSLQSMKYNFTNEGGYNYRFRFLKNIMGLWMIQNVKKEMDENISYGELCEQASRETIASIVNCNDSRFFAPASMCKEIQKACEESGQQVPVTLPQMAAVVYRSLAHCYGETLKEIEQVTGKTFSQINVIGGGANAGYLNELTAKATGRTVCAGPDEATAIGNIAVQMIAAGELGGLKEARECIANSFRPVVYEAV